MTNRKGTVVVLHYYATGPGQELYAWLKGKGEMAALVELPFPFSNRQDIIVRYSLGEGERQFAIKAPKGPFLWRCLRELFLTRHIFSLLEKEGFKVARCIGNGFFDVLAALWRRIPEVVMFSIDYAPKAYPAMLRPLYRFLDGYAAQRVKAVWNLSPRMQEAREKNNPSLKCRQVLTVPHGTHYNSLAKTRHMPNNPHSLIFMGHVKEDSGLDLAIRSLGLLKENFPDVSLTAIGGGPFLPNCKELAAKLGLGGSVKFLGFLESHEELERAICGCAVGLALYNPEKDHFTVNADPGKVKVYLGCGLPVIITDLPKVAAEIGERGAGAVVRYSSSSLAFGLALIFSDYAAYRQRAEEMGSDYDWEKIYSKAWERTFAE